MSEAIAIDPITESKSLPRISTIITLEMALYAGVFVIGVLLRWINLGRAPLSWSEADQALAALHNAPLPAGGSPVLYAINQIVLNIFGSSLGDVGPRIGSALIGSIVILLPTLYRDRIGRFGALAASIMLALSPTFVFASRSLDGSIAVVACGLAALGFGLRFARLQRVIDLIGLAISIGLGLTAGPDSVTLLITIGLGSIIVLRWVPSTESTEFRSALRSISRDQMIRAMMWGGAAFFLVSTVALLNPSAIRFVPENFSAWLQSFRTAPTISAARLLIDLILYEPLITFAGLIGLFAVLMRVDGTSVVLGLWSLGALILVLLQPGHQTLDLILALTPLALLAGALLQSLSDAFLQRGSWLLEGAVWLIGAPLAGYLALLAASTSISRQIESGVFLNLAITPAFSFVVTSLLLLLLISAVFVIAIGPGATLRSMASAVLAVLVLISLSNAWSVNQLRASDPRELMWGPITTAPAVRDAMTALRATSDRFTGDPKQISINVVAAQPNPIVQWYLRDFGRMTTSASPDLSAQAIIMPQAISATQSLGGYYGAQFAIRSIWNLDSLPPNSVLRWWLYREADQPAAFETISVWIKANP
jgi:predicted membrane-bound mannosyltransferase